MASAGAIAIPFAAQAQPAAMRQLLPGANVCILTPQQVEGPFYFDPKLVRSDIVEDRKGVALILKLQVVTAAACEPLKGARVDVWHADALGLYSGYPGQSDAHNISTEGGHFLRGTQHCDDDGIVTFDTIYPGWYRGRTTHIHCKVFLDDRNVLTTQLYFPDALSEYLYTQVEPYNTRGRERDTVNATDMLARHSDPDHHSFVSVKEEASRYLAALIIGVDRNATPVSGDQRPGRPPAGRAPGAEGPPSQTRPRGPLVPGLLKRP